MQTTIYLLKFAIFILGLGAVILIGYWLRMEYKVWKQRKRAEENLYEMKYKWLQNLINTYPVDESNYKYLKNQVEKLGQMSHKNHEKTNKLSDNFSLRFKSENTKNVRNLLKKVCDESK